MNEKSSWIGLKKNQGAGLESGCNIEWDLEQSTGKQLWVTIWIYVGRRADRDRLFSALAHEKGRLPESKTVFERSGGSASLSSYLDLDLFYSFDATFQTLIQEWEELLRGVGGIQPFTLSSDVKP